MTLDHEDITAIASEVAALIRPMLAIGDNAPEDVAACVLRSQAAQDLAAARERKARRLADKAVKEAL